ncbi:MAG: methionine--tRNA ligase [Actinomycetota bacterium]|nr:methionine--tRNA ligase [Actinomycetota bacterium]MDI6822510.1 methionine--tRNA ligase [Actinomycetota bacterium]
MRKWRQGIEKEDEMPKFYVTTPIYYVNQPPHLGTAYPTITADVIARYHRLFGQDVFFLTGTDEHGAKVAQSAESVGKSPKQFCDEIADQFKKTWEALNISNDHFIRTTDSEHERAVKWALQRLYDGEYVYRDKYEGLYCVGCEQYIPKSSLVQGKCPLHRKEPELLTEECYFFKLSQFQDELLTRISKRELKIEPVQRENEVLSFLRGEKLQDLAISRSKSKVRWGIELPFDRSHTTYVWVDAFLNYLTGIGWLWDREKFERYWPADVHLIGKDILRVHATIWPSLLLALGVELPRKIFVHGFFTVNGQKMSKSLGNVIDPVFLAGKYGVDALRYFILGAFPFGQDGDFSLQRLEHRYNADLANDLGNLVSRLLAMVEKYRDGIIPTSGKEMEIDLNLRRLAERAFLEADKCFREFAFSEALARIWEFIRGINKYIDEVAPWSLAKKEEQRERLDMVLYTALEGLRIVALLIRPFMPSTSKELWNQLSIEEKLETQRFPRALEWGLLKPGIEVKRGKPLFPRIK